MIKFRFVCSALVTFGSILCMITGTWQQDYTLVCISFSAFVGWAYHAMDDYQDMITISKIAKKYEQYDPQNS